MAHMMEAPHGQTALTWRLGDPQSVPRLTEQLLSWLSLLTFLITGAVFLVFIALLVWLLTHQL